jgi:hypothetical protein
MLILDIHSREERIEDVLHILVRLFNLKGKKEYIELFKVRAHDMFLLPTVEASNHNNSCIE